MDTLAQSVSHLAASNAGGSATETNKDWRAEYEKLLNLTGRIIYFHNRRGSCCPTVDPLEPLPPHDGSAEYLESLANECEATFFSEYPIQHHPTLLEQDILHLEHSEALTCASRLAYTAELHHAREREFRAALERVQIVTQNLRACRDREVKVLEAVRALKKRVKELELVSSSSKSRDQELCRCKEESDNCVFMVKSLRDDNHALVDAFESVKRRLVVVIAERDALRKEVQGQSKEKSLVDSVPLQDINAELKTITNLLQDGLASVQRIQQGENEKLEFDSTLRDGRLRVANAQSQCFGFECTTCYEKHCRVREWD
ncbi:hypothetical protein HDU98_007953 [Podochytrium sp. JEL0797]|nr:hypothetical protein HDU98_007953 [Podochytrium sp. JEL0797]